MYKKSKSLTRKKKMLLSLTEDEHRDLFIIAERDNIPASYLVRNLIKNYLDNIEIEEN